MSRKVELKIDWATHSAAEYAVMHWHYSKCMPKSKLAKFGVWEDDKFIGSIIYGVGATSDLVKRYGLDKIQGCELVRIALTRHRTPVSRMVSITLIMLRNAFPGLRLVVSFADPEQGHHGGIYQGGGWIYAGNSQPNDEYIFMGKRWQGRSFRNRFKGMEKDPRVQVVKGNSKLRYLMPLDKEMKKKLEPLAQRYPKRAGSIVADVSEFHSEEGGSIPTPALQRGTNG